MTATRDPEPVGSVVVTNGTRPDGSAVDVRVEEGVVTCVGEPASRPPPDRIPRLDATGQLVLPGLVEAHCHLDKTLFGRPWVSHAAEDTLQSRIATDRRLRVELGLPDRASVLALLERMISFGTSLVRTHTDVDPEVGLRGVHTVGAVAEQLRRSVRVEQVAFPQHGLLSLPGTADLLRAALAEGASVVGGLDPSADGDAAAYLDVVFGLAEDAGAQVDLHLHSPGATGLAEIDLVIERTRALGMGGRVVISHAYCFGDLDRGGASSLSDRLAGAGVGIVVAAPYNYPVPPVRTLVDAGVGVGCGHDGIRDLWGPYGTGDMLDRARHIAYRSGFRSDRDIELVLDAATSGGRRLLTGHPGGVAMGRAADIVLVPASCPAEAVVTAPHRRTILRGDLGPSH